MLGVVSQQAMLNAAAFSDNFNRPGENLEASANWDRVGGSAGAVTVFSNAMRIVSTADASAYLCRDLGFSDHYVQANRMAAGDGDYFLCCRLTNNTNFVGARRWSTGRYSIYKRVAGTFTELAGVNNPAQHAAGALMRLEVVGTNATLKLAGVTILGPTAIGSHTASTRAGVVPRNDTANPAFDNFRHGKL